MIEYSEHCGIVNASCLFWMDKRELLVCLWYILVFKFHTENTEHRHILILPELLIAYSDLSSN